MLADPWQFGVPEMNEPKSGFPLASIVSAPNRSRPSRTLATNGESDLSESSYLKVRRDSGPESWLHGFSSPLLFAAYLALAVNMIGCSSRVIAPPSDDKSPIVRSMFYCNGEASHCPFHCVSESVAIAHECLGIDPGELVYDGSYEPDIVWDGLDEVREHKGSTIVRIPINEYLSGLTEGPVTPSILIHETGHFYCLIGTIRVDGELECQIVHGDSPVFLVTKQTLQNGGFQEVWTFAGSDKPSVPIRVGTTTLEVNELIHNFGEIVVAEKCECSFRLENKGPNAIILDKPASSCSCTTPDLRTTMEIPSGGFFNLRVAVRPPSSTSLRQTIGLLLHERRSGCVRSIALSLLGTCPRKMKITPSYIDFGSVVQGKSYARTVLLEELPSDRFALVGVDAGELPITCKAEDVVNRDGLHLYRLSLRLSLRGHNVAGKYAGDLHLTLDGYSVKTMIVPIRYEVKTSIRVIPEAVAFGTVSAGASLERTIRIISNRENDCTVVACDVPKGCSVRVDRHTYTTVVILKVLLVDPGMWQDAVEITVRSRSGQQSVIHVPCAAYVLKPA